MKRRRRSLKTKQLAQTKRRRAYNAFRLFVDSFNDDLMYMSEDEKKATMKKKAAAHTIFIFVHKS